VRSDQDAVKDLCYNQSHRRNVQYGTITSSTMIDVLAGTARLHGLAATLTGKLARPRSIAARLACVRLLTPNLA
jgi:hypothetical protein